MELAYKEELFFILSVTMDKEESEKETERIANNFKSVYSPKPSKLEPIIGNKTYRYYIDDYSGHWMAEFESRVDVYENGQWKKFMKFRDGYLCRQLIERLKLGGNTVIEF